MNEEFNFATLDIGGYEPTEEQNDLLTALSNSQQTQEEKLNKRSKRLSHCDSWAHNFDPHTGKRATFKFYCDFFRECPVCLERRAYQEKEWMKKMVSKRGECLIVTDTRENISNMLRGIHKTNYVRYPQQDGMELLFIDPDKAKVQGKQVDWGWLDKQNWLEIVATPDGRNKSGTLHIPKPKVSEEKFTIITTDQIIIDAPYKVIDEVITEVMNQTSEMQPTIPMEVQICLNKRIALIGKKLQDRGIKYTKYVKKMKVVHDKINWDINPVYTKKTTNYPVSLSQSAEMAFLEPPG